MRLTATLLLTITLQNAVSAGTLTLRSPDSRLTATLILQDHIMLRLDDGATHILAVDSLTLAIRGQDLLGMRPVVERTERHSTDTVIAPPIREKRATLHDRYNELDITFTGGYGLVLRVYNEGVAYRFRTSFPADILVDREYFSLSFPDSARTTYQFQQGFWSAYENPYRTTLLPDIPTEGQCSLPILVDMRDGRKLLFTEAHIEDYPGLWVRQTGDGKLRAVFPGYPLEYFEEGKAYTRGRVTRHATEIARTRGTRTYPWRVFLVAREDADLLTQSVVYLLGEPSKLKDVSWVTPGVVTLDWWARRNLFGVDFAGGINTATAKYIIDFAAHYGLKYFMLDEGWTKQDDLLTTHPDLNIEEIVAYARGKGVRVILWAVWSTLLKQWDAAFERFSQWGISGVKVDFMNRDDQEMVNFYYSFAEETARRKMVGLFHGSYKPDGLRRTFPNIITREGLIEFEQNQVNLDDSPEYHTLLPFIRMATGPADYLPGTVRNAQKNEFRMITQRPMGQGTRAHSMALCVVLESPMRMFPDSPPDYYREDPCTRFMAEIPVQWDDIRVLRAKVGESVAIARRSGDEWFVAAITNWDPRDLEIDCSFLDPDVAYTVTSFRDGMNADRRAIDYVMTSSTAGSADRFTVHLAQGGGWLARFRPAVPGE